MRNKKKGRDGEGENGEGEGENGEGEGDQEKSRTRLTDLDSKSQKKSFWRSKGQKQQTNNQQVSHARRKSQVSNITLQPPTSPAPGAASTHSCLTLHQLAGHKIHWKSRGRGKGAVRWPTVSCSIWMNERTPGYMLKAYMQTHVTNFYTLLLIFYS